MIVVTGYVFEVGDRDDGTPEVVIDAGGDVMVTITCLSRENVARIAQHLNDLVTLTWCGTEVMIAEVCDA
jgi:hypothetical protein